MATDYHVGQEVLVDGRYGDKRVAKIERLTATQVILERGERYRRSNGRSIGTTTWNHVYILTDPEAIAKCKADTEREHLIASIENRAKTATVEQLRTAWAALKGATDGSDHV